MKTDSTPTLTDENPSENPLKQIPDPSLESITFGAGCFWCVEAVFQRIRGVHEVESGYAGGHTPHPTYAQVVTGKTGHAEVARIRFDSGMVTLEEILQVFWHAHDPTTLNRQGADVGTQYRSAIFYENELQREMVLSSRQKVEVSGLWSDPIVTEMVPLERFYRAEEGHQNYYNDHPYAGYCQVVIAPKLKKLRDEFPHLWSPAGS